VTEARTEPHLTRRASLTLGGSVLRQLARIAAAFLVTPVVIRALNEEPYGVWLIVQQIVAFLVLADLRASSTLKFTLAVGQDDDDADRRRREIGASIAFWLCTTPFLFTLGAIAMWFAPRFVDTIDVTDTELRVVLGICFTAAALDRILSLPAHALRGMNLDYRAARVDALTIMLAAVLAAGTVVAGGDLIGLACASLVGVLIINLGRYITARRALPWFGVARPSRSEVKRFAGLSGWLIFGDIAGLLLLGTELLIVGAIVGPDAAAVYATSQFLVRSTTPLIVELLGSGGPGVAQLASRREWDRVAGLRDETMRYMTGALCVIGAVTLIGNQFFVETWAGENLYAGFRFDVLFVAAGAASALARTDAIFIDAVLAFRRRAVVTLVCGIAAVGVGVLATREWGLTGMAATALGSRVLLLALTPPVLARATTRPTRRIVRAMFRPVMAMIGTLSIAATFSYFLDGDDLLDVLLGGSVVAIIAAVGWWFLGLDRQQRVEARSRLDLARRR
jgi:O-antigen/teichoic acid export membrane protein